MKKKFGERNARYVAFWLDEKSVLDRFKECHHLTRQLERIACSLDAAERILETPAPSQHLLLKAVDDVRNAAEQVKKKHWIPTDNSAYKVEKGARDLLVRATKSEAIDAKAASKLKATVQGLRAKAAALDQRIPNTCGLRYFEGIAKPAKD